MSHLFADVLGRANSTEYALRLLCAVSAVWLAAALAAIGLRRFSASLRHRIWSLSIATTLLLPSLVMILPERRVGAIRLPAVPAVVAQSRGASAIHAPSKNLEIAPHSDGEATQEFTSDAIVSGRYSRHQAISREGPVELFAPASGTASSTVDAPPAHRERWRLVLGVLWIVPMIWLVLRQVVSIYSARRLLCPANQIGSGRAITCIAHLCSRLGLRTHPQLLTSNLLTPVCLGWWRPCILLPQDWETWSDSQLEAVLTHELAHIARRDVLWQTLARLACAVYWPHPIAWIAAWRMRVERELACDDWVLNAGESSERYARWLLDVAIALKGKPHAAELVGVAMASRSGFEKRVSAILDEHRPRRPISRPLAIALSIIAIVLMGIAGTLSPLAPKKASAQQAAQSPMQSTAAPATQPAASGSDIVHVSGRVEDDKGQPLIDTTITAQFGGKEYLAHPTRDGSFAIVVESRWPIQATIRASNPDGSRLAFLTLWDIKLTGAEISNLHLTLRPAREFAVSVNDAKGAPVESALVVASAGFAVAGQAKTDTSGKATLRLANDAPLDFVLATKPDVGLDYFLFWNKGAPHTNPYQLEPDFAGPLKFELNGAVTVKVRVVDEQDRPISGVPVYPWFFEKPRKGNFANVSGLLWLSPFKQVTDQAGIAEYRFVSADQSKAVTFWTEIPGYARARWNYDPKSDKTEVVA